MHIVFDLDGTLADTHPGIAEAFEQAVLEVLPRVPVCNFMPLIGPPVREVFRQALQCQDDDTLDNLNASFRRHYDRGAWKKSTLYPGILNLIKSLRDAGVGLSVLTNKPAMPTSRILEHMGIAREFMAVISPDSKSPGFQTKTEAAEHMTAILGLTPSRTWLIGDSADDAKAAAHCGFSFAAAAYGYGKVEKHPKFPIDLVIECSEQIEDQLTPLLIRP